MTLPPEVDQLIRKRFESLVAEGEQLIEKAEAEAKQFPLTLRRVNELTRDKVLLTGSSFDALKTEFLSLLQLLADGVSRHINTLIADVRQLTNTQTGVYSLVGMIRGLKDDYENGMLINLVEAIEASVAADYLGQAEQLLKEGQSGKSDHVPAAVLLGAILEDALRRLCLRQTPPISLVKSKSKGEPKTLSSLIDDLKKANVFNELKAKQLRAWADIRNQAAHGKFDQFKRQDVDQMLVGVQTFLGDYM